MATRLNSVLLGAIVGLCAFRVLAQNSESVLGVPEVNQSLYVSKDGKWACLSNSSIVIDSSQINDGICDCPDGSDEPGTGACGMNGFQFFCKNEGFIPRYISQSKVGDGVCDCCDCSDEELTTGDIFYRGANCSQLQLSFNKFVEKELRRFEAGSRALKKMTAHADSSQKPKSKEELSQEISSLFEKLANSEKVLEGEKAEYLERLKTDEPLLYELEQLHIDKLARDVNEQFESVIKVSKAYEELVDILDGLVENYSRHLQDLVVNDNVKKYQFYKQQNLSKLTCDSKNENGLRDQLMVYFEKELPELFTYGLSDKPAKYLQGKATFVDMLILSKVEYTEVVMEAVGKLRAMMLDISENYNRNYQDQGVKKAVEAFKHYTSKYLSVGVIQIPQHLAQKLEYLREFVSAKAPELVTLAGSDIDAEEGGNGLMKQVHYLAQEIPRFFKPDIKGQIEKHQQDVESLRSQVIERRKELNDIIKREELGDDERTKSIKNLINEMSPYVENALDGYTYEIHFNGHIFQRANFGDQNEVSIGSFQNLRLNQDLALHKYQEYVRIKYSGDDELVQHLISETKDDKEEYLFGNLYQLNNGLELEFDHGDKCWDGPERSASVFVQCSEKTQINKITEVSRCRYVIELDSPYGCSQVFAYQPFTP
ncbi:GTB1 (YDR221W) [Zygosaccharomyces parabailii]|nr:GTB1 (YDR221W) [Zygosaccharomyces parabailii]CDH09906.1 related to Glucosidase 2 subunit beta [Zygosaccharomyces bailii ISA1307]